MEIRRVLKDDGTLYLGVPNRWALIEPHYRLPFLSWSPGRLASSLVRAAGKHDWYDCRPLDRSEVKSLLRDSGFSGEEVTYTGLELFLKHEVGHRPLLRLLSNLPTWTARIFGPIIPTLIFLAAPSGLSNTESD